VLRAIRGCLGCVLVSETAQIELRSERVSAPAVGSVEDAAIIAQARGEAVEVGRCRLTL